MTGTKVLKERKLQSSYACSSKSDSTGVPCKHSAKPGMLYCGIHVNAIEKFNNRVRTELLSYFDYEVQEHPYLLSNGTCIDDGQVCLMAEDVRTREHLVIPFQLIDNIHLVTDPDITEQFTVPVVRL